MFKCIVSGCQYSTRQKLRKPGNLKKHLLTHNNVKEWLDFYDRSQGLTFTSDKLDAKTKNIVKFFVSSNVAVDALQDKNYRACIKTDIGKFSFIHRILPAVFDIMKTQINVRLQKALYLHLITDIWTSSDSIDFIAVGAALTYTTLRRELIVLGMEEMSGRHTAENVKVGIESIVNKFDFNKSKIVSVSHDEGKNLLRLFKQRIYELAVGIYELVC